MAKKKAKETYWESLKWDLIEKLRPMFNRRQLYIDPTTKKITSQGFMQMDAPWVLVKAPPVDCVLLHEVVFKCLRFIHSDCLSCYKVVVKPHTVKQLFKLLEIMEDMNLPSKCGIDIRNYTEGMYGGYFYCRSLKEGEAVWKKVSKRVHKEISPDIDVILKRYCTEFEIALGPSTEYKRKPEHEKWEKLVAEHVELPKQVLQPEYLKNHIKRMWIAYANSQGDKTALEFNDGKPITTKLVTYHKREN